MSENKKYFILLFVIMIGFIFTNTSTKNVYYNDKLITQESIGDSLTLDNIRDYILVIGIKKPDIVLRQAILETGWMKCKNCSLDYNNLFGFRYRKKYIKFNHWKESVHYYANWQYYKGYVEGDDYYEWLENIGYAEDINYKVKLESVKL
jgi:hypothetical protein